MRSVGIFCATIGAVSSSRSVLSIGESLRQNRRIQPTLVRIRLL